ncbi:MAG: cobyrinate a,c-diamide synthase [Methanomicrobiales archaeon]|nr:cobyrinate a,c-diamide synthase [Methanomicrobiales archaeon]
MEIPRAMVAGTHSGCGKTTIAKGLMGALRARGLVVQPFKVGPDFIDPTHHTAICGRDSRNLDPFMMGKERLCETFVRASEGADIAVIEGVMGLYDGIDGGDVASTAHVSQILSSPVILVVDVKGMSRSVHAQVSGFTRFDPSIEIAGVIYNRVGSDRHRWMIERGMDCSGAIPIGWVPNRQELELPSRHLGLHLAFEEPTGTKIAEILEGSCDIDAVIRIAGGAPPLTQRVRRIGGDGREKMHLGVALDRAFCFYYKDNLERLASAGASLTFFSPLSDPIPDVSGIYLGGGYPELYAREMVESRFPERLKKAADDGMPIYGECGGLLVLCESLVTDKEHPMAGILPATARMTRKVQALDYVQARVIAGTGPLSPKLSYHGHEFHYSAVDVCRDARLAVSLSRGKGITGDGWDGLFVHHTLGSYTHAYFNDKVAASIVRAAERYMHS